MTEITAADREGLTAVTIASTLIKSGDGPALLAEQVRAGLVSISSAELALFQGNASTWPIDAQTIQEGHIIFVRDEADDEGVMGTYYTYRGDSITRNTAGAITGGSWIKLALGDQLTAAAVSALSGINFGVNSDGTIASFIRPQFQGSNLVTQTELTDATASLGPDIAAKQNQVGEYQAGTTYSDGDIVYFGLTVGGSTKNTLYVRGSAAASAGIAPNAASNNPWTPISDAEISGFTIPANVASPTAATDVASMGYVDAETPSGAIQETQNTNGTASGTKIAWDDLATKQFVEDESVTLYPTTDAEFNAFGNFRLSTGTIWIHNAELWRYNGVNVEIVVGNYADHIPAIGTVTDSGHNLSAYTPNVNDADIEINGDVTATFPLGTIVSDQADGTNSSIVTEVSYNSVSTRTEITVTPAPAVDWTLGADLYIVAGDWEELGIGGGSSSNTYTSLQDTPSAYPQAASASAERHNYVTVNSGNNGLDFVDPFPLSGAQNNQVATINGLVIRNIVLGDPTTGGGHIVFAIFEPRFASSAAPSGGNLRWDQPMTSATVNATNNDDVPGQYVNTVNSLTFNNVSFIDAPVVDASVTSGSTDLSYTVTSSEFYAKDAFTGSGSTSSNSTGNLLSWEVEDNNGNTYDSSSTQYAGANQLNRNVTWNAAQLGNTVNTGGNLPFDVVRTSFTVNHQVPGQVFANVGPRTTTFTASGGGVVDSSTATSTGASVAGTGTIYFDSTIHATTEAVFTRPFSVGGEDQSVTVTSESVAADGDELTFEIAGGGLEFGVTGTTAANVEFDFTDDWAFAWVNQLRTDGVIGAADPDNDVSLFLLETTINVSDAAGTDTASITIPVGSNVVALTITPDSGDPFTRLSFNNDDEAFVYDPDTDGNGTDLTLLDNAGTDYGFISGVGALLPPSVTLTSPSASSSPTVQYKTWLVVGSDNTTAFSPVTHLNGGSTTLAPGGYSVAPVASPSGSTTAWRSPTPTTTAGASAPSEYGYQNTGANPLNLFLVAPSSVDPATAFTDPQTFNAAFNGVTRTEIELGHPGHGVTYYVYTFTAKAGETIAINVA